MNAVDLRGEEGSIQEPPEMDLKREFGHQFQPKKGEIMLQKAKQVLLIFLTLIVTSTVQANHHKVILGEVVLGGSCKESSVSTRMDRRTGHFIIAPTDYIAVIENGATLARKTCNFAIAFKGRAERAIRLRLPKVKGTVALDQGSTAEIQFEIFFAGLMGEKTNLKFTGDNNIAEQDFDETSSTQEMIYECGKSGIIRGNSSILLHNNNPKSHIALTQIQKFGVKIDSVSCSDLK